MKRTTKYSNSPGKEYFENAAKQIPWPVEVGQKKDDYKGVIHVPHFDLNKANDNLMVAHLIGYGFVIQQTITGVIETKVFNPELRLWNVAPKPRTEVGKDFGIGQQFRVKSTGTVLEIIGTIGGLELKYVDGSKLPIRTNEIQVQKSLDLRVWERL